MTIGFQCLTTIRYGKQGIVWACRGGGGAFADPGGGGGGLDPIGKSHVTWVDLDLNPLIPLTKFPGSAHGGGGGGGLQFISLECIRTDCLMEDLARGDSIPARGLGLTENDGFHIA